MQRTNKKKNQRGKRPIIHRQPPQLSINVQLQHTYRFRATSAFSGIITVKQLAGILGTVCTVVNSTVVPLASSFRVTRLEMWAPPPSQGADVTCSVEWVGLANSITREFSDTSMSTAYPAHVDSRPPVNTLGSFWQISNTTANFMQMVVPIGTVLDLHVSWIITDDDVSGFTIAVATAVLGNIYYLPLDHTTAGGAGVIQPVSLTATD